LGSSSPDGDASSPSRPSRSPTDGPAHIPRAHVAFHARDAIRAVRNISATRNIVRDARPASLPAPPLLPHQLRRSRAHTALRQPDSSLNGDAPRTRARPNFFRGHFTPVVIETFDP
jgi:hypothetical protein